MVRAMLISQMNRFSVYCTAMLSFLSVSALGQQADPRNAIPLFHTEIPQHLLATQFNFSAGTGRLTRSDKPLLSGCGEVKGLYNITGGLYLSTGAGIGYLQSEVRPEPGMEAYKREALLGYFPSGIGFSIGDDYATIITGIDVLPGFYLYEAPKGEAQRLFTYGIGPEFGFLFRVGPRNEKGLLIGMVGKLQFMQSPDLNDGPSLRYTYGGIGMVVRFY